LATISAPLVENGDASTIEDARHSCRSEIIDLVNCCSRRLVVIDPRGLLCAAVDTSRL
jgi:hypothetical protein